MKRWIPLALFMACGMACGGSGSGPGGAYDEYDRCATWMGGDYCPDPTHSNVFVCDVAPGDDCVPSAKPTPSQNQIPFCCSFPCVRGAPNSDGWCTGAKRESYICYGSATDVAKQFGCDPSSQNNLICC